MFVPTAIAQRIGPIVLCSIGIAGFASTLSTPAPAKPDFEHDVLPIFKAHCLPCHSTIQKQGGLTLDSGSAILSGRSVTVGKSAESLLMDRILGRRNLPRMPMGFAPLSDKDTQTVRNWIDSGCLLSSGKRAHWAYAKPIRPPLPALENAAWVRNPIDAFVLAKQRVQHLTPSPEADRTTLLRRVTLDLTGLPPTLQELDAFLADRSPNAFDKVVDRLLASPHFGERMALPWLDAARYADSNGFQQDGDTYQYVWRDWVIRALNDNMPFDRFTVEQLAGDLLPGANKATPEGRDKLIATAFVRNNMLNGEGGAIPEEQRNVALFDRVDTCSTTWLGLTMACARCHDHKYDPLTQRDYYSMLAFFNNVPESGVPSDTFGSYYIAQPWIYAGNKVAMAKLWSLEAQSAVAKEAAKADEASTATQDARAEWESDLVASPAKQKDVPGEILALIRIQSSKRTQDGRSKLAAYFLDHGLSGEPKAKRDRWRGLERELADLKTSLPKVMVMSDRQPRKTFVYSRGNYESHLAQVSPETPASLPHMPSRLPKNRLGLAEWIISPENPLTARVQVNRYWQQFFGRGLVKTPENFGVQSEPPVNQPLLDWLAVEFRESGWNVKRLVRLIVTSATYRQSSRVTRQLWTRDPENRFLARGPRFRLPAMLIRDEALAASGLINLKMGGRPVYPYQPKGIWDGLNITDERDFSYPESKGPDLYRRSIYTFWRRTVAPGDMFDAASRQVCTVRQSQTSTPLHALTTLNDVTWVEAGRALADHAIRESRPTPSARLSDAFRRVCSRFPSTSEQRVLERSLDRSFAAFRADPKAANEFLHQGQSPPDSHINPVEEAAYANVCLAILNLDEALTKE
ncbi:MAG: PSD1 and planctomycete cytochrome C domain-containing protein [Fimbriimonas sp.]|nr:PSD1 and planctomycete cytochrome C domain-containing protein [Fimbriimonas sp.]